MKITSARFTILILVLGFLLYTPSLFNSFIWDDEEQVLLNSAVHSFSNIPSLFTGSTFNTGGAGLGGMYYKPLMSVVFALFYSTFGPNAAFFHLVQLLFYLGGVCLLFLFLSHLFKNYLPHFVALVFLVHPINVETVVYISALQDTLFFFFGTWALFLARINNLSYKRLSAVSLLLLLSVLSKETGVLFLLLLPIFKLLTYKKDLWGALYATFAAGLIYAFLRFLVAGIYFAKTGISPIMRTTLLERLQTAPAEAFYYLKNVFFPESLAIAQHWVVRNADFNNFWLPLFFDAAFFAALASGLWLFRKDKLNFRLYSFFLIWFLLGFGLHLNVFPLDMTVADRWFYFPLAGLLVSFGMVFEKIFAKYLKSKAFLYSFLTVFAFLVLGLSGRTVIRILDWKNGLTLYSKDIAVSKGSFDLENNLGVELFRSGKEDEAAIHFQKSAELAPYWWTNWNNLGVYYEKRNDYKKARQFYEKSAQNNDYYLAYENLAALLLNRYSAAETVEFTGKALKKFPQNPKLWYILSVAEYKAGDKDKSLAAAINSYNLNPSKSAALIIENLKLGKPLDFGTN